MLHFGKRSTCTCVCTEQTVSLRPKQMHSSCPTLPELGMLRNIVHTLLPSWIQNQDIAGKDMLSSVYRFFICSHWKREHNAETKHLFLVIDTSYLTLVQLSSSLIQLPCSYPSGSHNLKKLDWSSDVHISWVSISIQEVFCPYILKMISNCSFFNFHHVLLRSIIMSELHK